MCSGAGHPSSSCSVAPADSEAAPPVSLQLSVGRVYIIIIIIIHEYYYGGAVALLLQDHLTMSVSRFAS